MTHNEGLRTQNNIKYTKSSIVTPNALWNRWEHQKGAPTAHLHEKRKLSMYIVCSICNTTAQLHEERKLAMYIVCSRQDTKYAIYQYNRKPHVYTWDIIT